MADSSPTRPAPSSARRLLTRQQVIAALREERTRAGLTVTARRYGLRAQQLCDVLAVPQRAKMSRRMTEKMAYKLWEFYEKKGE